MVKIEEVQALELRVGRIVEVVEHEKARKPMYILRLNLGSEIGERTIVAGIRDKYTREELLGKSVVCIVNLEPREIAGVTSQGMLLAAEDENTVALLTVDRQVKEGSKVH